MTRYITRRLAQAVVVIAGVLVITFIIARLVPGDPAVAYAGRHASAEELARVRTEFGLDKPVLSQLWDYVLGIVTFGWGTSLHTKQPVLDDLGRVIPPTIELAGLALVIAVAIGLPLGVVAARARGRWQDAAIRLASVLSVSMPVFWLALILQYVFFTKLGWLPVSGEYTPSLDHTSPLTSYTGMTLVDSLVTGNLAVFRSAVSHVVLPALAVAAYAIGTIAMLTRASLLDTISEDHVRMVRALGFSEKSVFTRFALKPSMHPVLAVIALLFAYSLTNTFLVESVFNWPGLGRYTVDSIRSLDSPAIIGVAIFVAIVYVVLNLIVDIVQTLIDPRIAVR
jgi:peptide/nickel transport system permease protein